MFYRARLAHPDPDGAERAARALFDLEKTRHGRELAGTPNNAPFSRRFTGGPIPAPTQLAGV